MKWSCFCFMWFKAPAGYPYPDPYYRSIFAPYDGQPYPPQPYGGQPMVCYLDKYYSPDWCNDGDFINKFDVIVDKFFRSISSWWEFSKLEFLCHQMLLRSLYLSMRNNTMVSCDADSLVQKLNLKINLWSLGRHVASIKFYFILFNLVILLYKTDIRCRRLFILGLKIEFYMT